MEVVNSSISYTEKSSSEKIKLRLFGVELDPSDHEFRETDKGSPESGDESVNSSASSTVTEKPPPGKSSTLPEMKKFECRCCCKVFANSQALGGHQNAHRKERRKKKLQHLSYYIQPSYKNYSQKNSDNSYNYYGSNSLWFYDPSLHPPEVRLNKETYISFGPHSANLDINDRENFRSSNIERCDYILNQQNIKNNSLTRLERSGKMSRPISNKSYSLPNSKKICGGKNVDLRLELGL